jgi:histidinol-phosphate aminotransferase
VADILNRVRGPFNVNAAAMAAGIAAVSEPDWVERSVAHNDAWRATLSAGLRAAGVTVHPSEGNFVLADFGTAARARAADAALRARGLIARGVGAYALPQCLRITVGTGEECTMVVEALAAFMKSPEAAAAHG